MKQMKFSLKLSVSQFLWMIHPAVLVVSRVVHPFEEELYFGFVMQNYLRTKNWVLGFLRSTVLAQGKDFWRREDEILQRRLSWQLLVPHEKITPHWSFRKKISVDHVALPVSKQLINKQACLLLVDFHSPRITGEVLILRDVFLDIYRWDGVWHTDICHGRHDIHDICQAPIMGGLLGQDESKQWFSLKMV